MFTETTGSKQVLVRAGFSDYDSYGSDNYAMAATGNLDAPDYMPQGSVRLSCTGIPNPQMSHAHRDYAAGCMALGCGHDGPEAVPLTLPEWEDWDHAKARRYREQDKARGIRHG